MSIKDSIRCESRPVFVTSDESEHATLSGAMIHEADRRLTRLACEEDDGFGQSLEFFVNTVLKRRREIVQILAELIDADEAPS